MAKRKMKEEPKPLFSRETLDYLSKISGFKDFAEVEELDAKRTPEERANLP